ncbi:MAG: hypothetical protein ACI97B_003334, partial [Verrucomicrobiales bacterium]
TSTMMEGGWRDFSRFIVGVRWLLAGSLSDFWTKVPRLIRSGSARPGHQAIPDLKQRICTWEPITSAG